MSPLQISMWLSCCQYLSMQYIEMGIAAMLSQFAPPLHICCAGGSALSCCALESSGMHFCKYIATPYGQVIAEAVATGVSQLCAVEYWLRYCWHYSVAGLRHGSWQLFFRVWRITDGN